MLRIARLPAASALEWEGNETLPVVDGQRPIEVKAVKGWQLS